MTSSKYTATKIPIKSLKTQFISLWKVPGALLSPNGMTRNSYNPEGVIKAVFSTSSGCIDTCQYPLAKSNVVNHWDPPRESNKSSIRERGYASIFVTALSFL